MRHRDRVLLVAGIGLVAVPVILRVQEARDRAKLARGPLSSGEMARLCRAAGYRPVRDLPATFYDWQDTEGYSPPESSDLDRIEPDPGPMIGYWPLEEEPLDPGPDDENEDPSPEPLVPFIEAAEALRKAVARTLRGQADALDPPEEDE